MKEGDTIGRITIEFDEQDKKFVDRLMCAVEQFPAPIKLWIGSDELLSLSELEIYPGRRKAYIGGENNSVGCHIRNLRRKLFKEYPDAPFIIRCHRNIGYCLEMI